MYNTECLLLCFCFASSELPAPSLATCTVNDLSVVCLCIFFVLVWLVDQFRMASGPQSTHSLQCVPTLALTSMDFTRIILERHTHHTRASGHSNPIMLIRVDLCLPFSPQMFLSLLVNLLRTSKQNFEEKLLWLNKLLVFLSHYLEVRYKHSVFNSNLICKMEIIVTKLLKNYIFSVIYFNTVQWIWFILEKLSFKQVKEILP